MFAAAAVVAAEAGVERAAETLVVEHGEGTEADALLVVKFAAVGDMAAAHLALRLLASETRVDALKKKKKKTERKMGNEISSSY